MAQQSLPSRMMTIPPPNRLSGPGPLVPSHVVKYPFPLTQRQSSATNISSQAEREDTPLVKWSRYIRQFMPAKATFRKYVESAVQQQKTFSVPFCAFPTLRRVMHERGWIEIPPITIPVRRTLSEIIASAAKPLTSNSTLESNKISKILALPYQETDDAWAKRIFLGVKPKFIWHYGNLNWKSINDDQIINRQPKPAYSFTTKVGIAACLNEIHWYTEGDVSNTLFPRCYRLYIEEERAVFVGDFCITACMGLIQWIIGMYEKHGKDGIIAEDGQVATDTVSFAFNQVRMYVKARRNKDLDQPEYTVNFSQEWEDFLTQFHILVHEKSKLKLEDGFKAEKWYSRAKKNLELIAPYWPQLKIDGTNNLWICKPGAQSCGTGITIKNRLNDILKSTTNNEEDTACRSYWVVQKYIERPLLVYNAKFDIRQWFIVEDWNPLTVWFYKECYLRFCSEPFSIETFNENVHLCNFSIQKKYSISEYRDANLPAENVWDNYTFQAYLETLGKMPLWDSLIYPGMKRAILGVLLTSQESLFSIRKNCFELYGADFMLTDDLSPWLIEVNSMPLMSNANEIYKRMCSQVVEDTVKVIFDRKEKPNADTGMFELIYKQHPFRFLPVITPDVIIRGRTLTQEDEEGINFLSSSQSYQSLQGKKSLTLALQLHKSRPASLLSLRSGIYFMDLMQRIPLQDAKQNQRKLLPKTHSDYLRYPQDANFIPNDLSKTSTSLAPKKPKNIKKSSSKIPKKLPGKTESSQGAKTNEATENSNVPITSLNSSIAKSPPTGAVRSENPNSRIPRTTSKLLKEKGKETN